MSSLLARIPYRVCPLCEGTSIPPILQGDCSRHPRYHPSIPSTMLWLGCTDCSHVFTEGYLSDEAAALVFSGSANSVQQVAHDFEQQAHISARMVERVVRHLPSTSGDWLDVGFGNGSLMCTAEEWGFTPVGIDLRPSNVASLAGLGYEAHLCDVATLDQPGRFRVISMADVLEHMPFPILGLSAALRLLRPDGLLFLSMPNRDSFVWRRLDMLRANPYWGELEHYHNFGRTRLYRLLEDHGFTPIAYGVSERYRACMEVVASPRGIGGAISPMVS